MCLSQVPNLSSTGASQLSHRGLDQGTKELHTEVERRRPKGGRRTTKDKKPTGKSGGRRQALDEPSDTVCASLHTGALEHVRMHQNEFVIGNPVCCTVFGVKAPLSLISVPEWGGTRFGKVADLQTL